MIRGHAVLQSTSHTPPPQPSDWKLPSLVIFYPYPLYCTPYGQRIVRYLSILNRHGLKKFIDYTATLTRGPLFPH